MQSVA